MLDAYWKEAVYITDYLLNRGQLIVNKDKTPYELWYRRPASVKYFKYLAVSVTLKGTRMILESLTLGMMKEYF